MRGYELPSYMVEGMVNYLVKGLPPGSFSRSLLENDLAMAVVRADPENRVLLRQWVMFMNNEIPPKAWGSQKTVRLWIESKTEREDL